MNHGSLFSGIGGFDLAAEWAGWNNVFHCEWNEFGQKVLKYYWPNAISYGDITKTDFTIWRGRIDVLTGGFPCQPFSMAGKRKGTADDRHLWPQMLRAICEIQPRWIVGENVPGLVNWSGGLVFEQVQADLEAAGYEVTPFILPACAVNAPHRRDRIWIVAHAKSRRINGINRNNQCKKRENWLRSNEFDRSSQQSTSDPDRQRFQEQGELTIGGIEGKPVGEISAGDAANTKGTEQKSAGGTRNGGQGLTDGNPQCDATNADRNERCERGMYTPRPRQAERHVGSCDSRLNGCEAWLDFPTQPPVRGRNDGVSGGLDGITVSKHRNESIKAYGNAIVPQVALMLFKAINEYELL